jgi:hypothetical protein
MEPETNESGGPVDFEQWELLAYIDGASDPQTASIIAAQLERNSLLAAEIKALAETEARLVSLLSAGPSSHELGEYALGLLPPERAADLEQRLARDPDARRRLENLTTYLAAPDALPLAEADAVGRQIGRRIRVIIAQLAAGLGGSVGPGMLAPMPAGVRGDGSRALTYTVGDGQLVLEVEPSVEDRTKRNVLGLLVGFEQPDTLVAFLYRADALIAHTALDELGNFTLTALQPGAYHLILRGDTLEISAPEIQVT